MQLTAANRVTVVNANLPSGREPRLVDKGAIGAVEILQQPSLGTTYQSSVGARDARQTTTVLAKIETLEAEVAALKNA